ncbi:MAG: cytochrome d ubiquinol oxidase subunit II [Prevotella sp.]|nr:cytochrome d ubiquinol oxidase subunit II [Prevotella sp.]
MTYSFLQHYWWLVVSLLGAILVFLLFVQGANSLVFSLGRTPQERRLVINSTGRKWEFTFTTLVTFGGAFFASFPLFYSTSFGGAYWLWMLILFTFVLQAVSYEFQNKTGGIVEGRFAWVTKLVGAPTFQTFLVLNGLVGPLLLGGAVATFFEGSNFMIDKASLTSPMLAGGAGQSISYWGNASNGLDALLCPWVLVLGLAVMFLARTLGTLYIINNVDNDDIRSRARRQLLASAALFVVLFVVYLVHLLLKDGYAYTADGTIVMEPNKYLHNLLALWPVAVLLLIGVVLVLWGIVKELDLPVAHSLAGNSKFSGIWPAGIGTVLTVLCLLLLAGWNNTAYYPSTADLQASLTIENSSSSLFTLKTMFWVSLLVPFVLAYIVYCWRKIDSQKITAEELAQDSEAY